MFRDVLVHLWTVLYIAMHEKLIIHFSLIIYCYVIFCIQRGQVVLSNRNCEQVVIQY